MLLTLFFIIFIHHSIIFNLNNLSEHRVDKGTLFLQKVSHSGNVVLLLGKRQLTLLLGFGAKSLLEDLKAVLGVLVVEFIEVADAANASENTLIADERGLGTEGGDHSDTLAAAEGLESLVLDISALKDNGSTLSCISWSFFQVSE